ncbi:MAG: hypothetical protein DRP55_08755 [Spirochaetes bacterium]|nr:MAG: hypothetical protein DRP55_08755 [Spirochaetota bacterium]
MAKKLNKEEREKIMLKRLGFILPNTGTYYGWKIGDLFYEGDTNSEIIGWWKSGRAYLRDGRIVYVSKHRKSKRR